MWLDFAATDQPEPGERRNQKKASRWRTHSRYIHCVQFESFGIFKVYEKNYHCQECSNSSSTVSNIIFSIVGLYLFLQSFFLDTIHNISHFKRCFTHCAENEL